MEEVAGSNPALCSMKDTYGKRTYKCKCGVIADEFVWDSEVKKYKFSCASCSKEMGYVQLVIEKTGQSAAIRTPTKNR